MTLLMRDQENIEKGIQQGREEGRKEGREEGRKEGKIYGTISTYRELGLPDSEILERLQNKYHITESEAEAYMQEAL